MSIQHCFVLLLIVAAVSAQTRTRPTRTTTGKPNRNRDEVRNLCRTGCTHIPAARNTGRPSKKLAVIYSHAVQCSNNERFDCFMSTTYQDDYTAQFTGIQVDKDNYTVVLSWFNQTTDSYKTMAFPVTYNENLRTFVNRINGKVQSFSRVIVVDKDYSIMHGCGVYDSNEPDKCGEWVSIGSTNKTMSNETILRALKVAQDKGIILRNVQRMDHSKC